jgi:hypothetical protein
MPIMDDPQFSAWQTIYMDAVTETNPKNLREGIRAAEKSVLLRAGQIEDLNDQPDEKVAINNALKCLRRLKWLSEWV